MNFYHELDLESVLQCPVCMEIPPNVIVTCKVGHHMCDRCRKRLTSCPTCTSSMTSSRNFLAEALIARFSIFKDGNGDIPANNETNKQPQANITAGINSLVARDIWLRNNTDKLKPLCVPSGTYKCLLDVCLRRDEMGVGNMYTHIQSKHSQLYHKFQNDTATFEHNFENFCLKKNQRKHSLVMHVSNMGLFFLVLQVLDEGYIHCWISAPAPVCKTNHFDYALELVNENDDTKLQFTNKVASNLQTLDWLLHRAKVFVIPPTKHLLQNGKLFSMRVKIVYKMPSS